MPVGFTMAVAAAVGDDGLLQVASLKGPVTRLQRYDAPPGVQVAVSDVSWAVVGLVTPEIEHVSFAQVSVKLPPTWLHAAGSTQFTSTQGLGTTPITNGQPVITNVSEDSAA